MLNSAIKVADRADIDYVRITFGLNDDFAPSDWIGVKNYGIDSAVTACLSHPDLAIGRSELSFENLSNEMLEILPMHCGKVGSVIHASDHVL